MQITVCEDMHRILSISELKLTAEKIPYYEYNIDKIMTHVKECEFCKQSFIIIFKDLEIPLPMKLLINNLLTTL
ncbi:MAG: hypothetical protein M0P71_16195 [Melioribacteraceae bacterium]|jgi:hypothetical protein|nr:hypothetical protein [Melioribacteraceae bacterium]